MRPFWKVPPNLPLEAARSPDPNGLLSGVVLGTSSPRPDVITDYCNVKIGPRALRKIGLAMPQGVGPENQAYLLVVKGLIYYEVYCCYVDGSHKQLLWVDKELPQWCKLRKGKTNGESTKKGKTENHSHRRRVRRRTRRGRDTLPG